MSTAGAESPVSDRKAVVNFSRPRLHSNATTTSRPTTPNPLRSLTSHSSDHDRASLPSSPSAATEFTWDDRRGELVSQVPKKAPLPAPAQRHPGVPPRTHSPPGTDPSSASTSTRASLHHLMMPKSILKHTQVEQYSERADSDAGASDDAAGGSGLAPTASTSTTTTAASWDPAAAADKWSSSDYDTAALSEREIRKLVRKGVNPSLYVEMRAARKGKSCVGGLTGNAYVS